MAEAQLPEPFGAACLEDPDARKRLEAGLEGILQEAEDELGVVVASLGAGLYHIRKVLLEVASRDDRREQIAWEVGQALISPPEDYIVRYYAARRAAVWMAARRRTVERLAELLARCGASPDAFGVEPMAMVRACEMSEAWGPGRCAAVWIDPPWASLAAGEGGTLVAAETVHIGRNGWDQATPGYGPEAAEHRDLRELVRGWVHEGGGMDQQRTAYDRIFICGAPGEGLQIAQDLERSGAPGLSELAPLSSCDTHGLPEAQHALLRRQEAFCIAAGLASLGLGGSVPERDPADVPPSLPEADAGLTLLP
jgi:hypothetical protein